MKKKIILHLIVAFFTILLMGFVACGKPSNSSSTEQSKVETESLEMLVGETYRINVNDKVYSSYGYESSNETVVSVSDAGIITAKTVGQGIVKIIIDGTVCFEYTVSVAADDFVPPVVGETEETAYRITRKNRD